MKTVLLVCLSLLLRDKNAFAQHNEKAKQLTEIINDAWIPGIQLIYAKGNVRDVYNLGTIATDSKDAVTSTTIFEAASLSKAVFAYSVFRLIDRGVIQLDTPLLHYIGHFDRFDPANPAYEKITARMVLRHTTGFPNWGDSTLQFIFPPDSCFSYSGEGYQYLQHVVEKLTKKSLEQIAQEEVFIPLKMTSSGFKWSAAFAGRAAFPAEAAKWHNELYAASSLLTTAHDYSIFLDAVLTGKGLSSKSHHLMLDQATAGNWFKHPVTAATAHIGWGLGVGIQQNEKGKAIWQWGDNGDFKSYYIAFPETHESLVYLTHSEKGHFITADVIDLFLGKQTTWAIKWLGAGYDDPGAIKEFRSQLEKRGVEQASAIVNEYKISEHDLNEYGFILMKRNKKESAVDIFKLNLSLHPNSSNAFDGLAEAYQALGNKELAISNFKKCLELNPANEYAAKQLKELGGQGAAK